MAIDIPPSQYTGQWALSWYDIPHCGGKTLPSQLRDPVASQLVGILACWLAIMVHPLGNSVCLGLSAHGASIAGSSRPAICHCHYLTYSMTHLPFGQIICRYLQTSCISLLSESSTASFQVSHPSTWPALAKSSSQIDGHPALIWPLPICIHLPDGTLHISHYSPLPVRVHAA